MFRNPNLKDDTELFKDRIELSLHEGINGFADSFKILPRKRDIACLVCSLGNVNGMIPERFEMTCIFHNTIGFWYCVIVNMNHCEIPITFP